MRWILRMLPVICLILGGMPRSTQAEDSLSVSLPAPQTSTTSSTMPNLTRKAAPQKTIGSVTLPPLMPPPATAMPPDAVLSPPRVSAKPVTTSTIMPPAIPARMSAAMPFAAPAAAKPPAAVLAAVNAKLDDELILNRNLRFKADGLRLEVPAPRHRQVEAPFHDWTLRGRDPTLEDLAMIQDNVRRLLTLSGQELSDVDYDGDYPVFGVRDPDVSNGITGFPGGTVGGGSMIAEFFPYISPGWGISGLARERVSSGPFFRDEDEIAFTAPDTGTRWIGAPYPWVIHIRPPRVGVYTPSPFYENPFVPITTTDANGNQINTFVNIWPQQGYAATIPRNASNSFGWDSDSDVGANIFGALFRDWGNVNGNYRNLNPANAANRGKHNLNVSLRYNSGRAAQAPSLFVPAAANAGAIPSGMGPTAKVFRKTAGGINSRTNVPVQVGVGPARIPGQPLYPVSKLLGKPLPGARRRPLPAGARIGFTPVGASRTTVRVSPNARVPGSRRASPRRRR